MVSVEFAKQNWLKYNELIDLYSERWKIKKELICALIHEQSNFEKDKEVFLEEYYRKSMKELDIPEDEKKWRATRIGLLQITGQTAREIGYREYRDDFSDPALNIYFGLKYFNSLLRYYRGDENFSIIAFEQTSRLKRVSDKDGNYLNKIYLDNVLKLKETYLSAINTQISI